MALTRVLLQQDTIAKFTKIGNTTATLGSLTLTTSVSGVGGLDTGAIAVSTFYYVYTVLSSGVIGLICSTSAVAPTGFGTGAYKVGAFYTDASTNIFKAYFYGEDLLDMYSAQFSTTGVLSNPNYTGWIASSTNANPIVVTYTSGIFSVTPNITLAATTAGTQVGLISAQSASSCSLYGILPASGGGAAESFSIHAQKTGIDATKPDWSR